MNQPTTSTRSRSAIEAGGEPVDGQVISGLLPRRVDRPMSTVEVRRIATMERRVPQTMERARQAGVSIDFLGTAPLFNNARIYAGDKTDWVFAPADESETLVPREQAQALKRLCAAGINMPLLYVAHEIPKAVVPVPTEPTGGPLVTMERAQAKALLLPVPPPSSSVELSHRLNQRSKQVFSALTQAATFGVAVAAAPFQLVGAAASALASLDPMIIGAVPAVGTRPGDPATWWLLARWDW
jgi:hypothetical protein